MWSCVEEQLAVPASVMVICLFCLVVERKVHSLLEQEIQEVVLVD